MNARSEPAPKESTPESLYTEHLLTTLRDLALPPYAVYRTTVLPFDRNRRENDAEHSFSLGVVAICMAPLIDEHLDLGLISQYALIHDLVEIYAGDTSVYADQPVQESKRQREESAYQTLKARYGLGYPWLLELLEDYRSQLTPESNYVYALDKVLPHAMVLIGDYHPVKPEWERYKQTERRARDKIAKSCPGWVPVFDELCRRYALRPHLFSTPPDQPTTRSALREKSARRVT
jgi:hypothetical protein